MKTLFVDTSRKSLSIALADNDELIFISNVESYSKHSNYLMDEIKKVLSKFNLTPNDIDNLSALSYFPAKVLEIIDTYDVLYRDFSKDEIKGSIDNKILSFMYENFLDNKIKIDPIIFSIFIKYIENIKNISVVDCPL